MTLVRRGQDRERQPLHGHLLREFTMIRLLCVVGTLILTNSPAEGDPAAARTPAVAQNRPHGLALMSAEPNPGAPSTTTTAQLPPEIMVDRHLIRAERLLADDDPDAAFEAMNEILALQQEHDLVLQDNFHFQYARIAFAAGRTETAIASVSEYLIFRRSRRRILPRGTATARFRGSAARAGGG